MPLEVGSRLGPYTVTAKIGEGGMGEVYRATDTKLDRQVALKILHEVRHRSCLILRPEPTLESLTGEAPHSIGMSVRPGRQRPAGMAIAVVVCLAIGSVAACGSTAPISTNQLTATLPETDQLPDDSGGLLALSPYGETLVYRADAGGQLFRRPVSQLAGTAMFGTEGARAPFFSPDGWWIGYWADGELRKVSVSGGPPVTIPTLPDGFRGASWGENDQIVLGFDRPSGVLRQVSAAGGHVTSLLTLDEQWIPSDLQVLPGSRAVLFTQSEEGRDRSDLHLLNLETGEHRTVIPDAAAGYVLESDHLVFIRNGAPWAVQFDALRLEPMGEPVPVVNDAQLESVGTGQFVALADGSLVYSPTGTEQRLAWNVLKVLWDHGANASLRVDGDRGSLAAEFRPLRIPEGQKLTWFIRGSVTIKNELFRDLVKDRENWPDLVRGLEAGGDSELATLFMNESTGYWFNRGAPLYDAGSAWARRRGCRVTRVSRAGSVYYVLGC